MPLPLKVASNPSKLLMGRKIRTMVPTLLSHLEPSWPYIEQFREKDSVLKSKQRKTFHRLHSVKSLPDPLPGDPVCSVCLPCKKIERTVIDKAGTPQSDTVATPNSQLRRNRCHLNLLPKTPSKMESTPWGEPSPCKGPTAQ